jgi:hypothetical protein
MTFRSKITTMPNITEIRKDIRVIIFTEKDVALGFPAPSSLLTLTLANLGNLMIYMNWAMTTILGHLRRLPSHFPCSGKGTMNLTHCDTTISMPEYNLNLLRLAESSSNAKAKLQSKGLIDSGLCHHDKLSTNAALNIPNPSLYTAHEYSHVQRFAT